VTRRPGKTAGGRRAAPAGERSGGEGGRAPDAAGGLRDRADGLAGADPFEELRRRIDAIDHRVVALLNERAGHAITLGRIKKERGLTIYQPAREEEVLRNVQESNAGPLEDAALRRLFERIIDESRRIERVATAGTEETAGPERAREPGPEDPAASSD